MRLVVFGDSFVEGYQRSKDGSPILVKENFVNRLALLLRDFEITVRNMGHRGHSNVAISYDVFTYLRRVKDLRNTFVLVVWSEWDRNYLVNHEVGIDSMRRVVGIQNAVKSHLDVPEMRNYEIKRWQTEISYHGVCNALTEANVPFLMISSNCNQMFRNVLTKKRNHETFEFVYDREKILDHWIEGDRPNNTLLDIITDNWLNESDHIDYKTKLRKIIKSKDSYKNLTDCLHPTIEGHKLIAETLEPYIRRRITDVTTRV
jgi:lysophospholipase L1-like esterase